MWQSFGGKGKVDLKYWMKKRKKTTTHEKAISLKENRHLKEQNVDLVQEALKNVTIIKEDDQGLLKEGKNVQDPDQGIAKEGGPGVETERKEGLGPAQENAGIMTNITEKDLDLGTENIDVTIHEIEIIEDGRIATFSLLRLIKAL